MALEIDGFAVFHSISTQRAAFARVTADLAKSARTILVKLIKDKKTDLAALRAIRTALGPESFNLIVDGMPDLQIKSVLGNLDKHHSEIKTSDRVWQRCHLLALADGSAQSAEKPKSPPKQQKVKKPQAVPKTLERISFSSAGATRKR